MSLDLHQLRTFCVVAEEENVSRAAERLYLSAPSVSAHIKALEEELGVRLFTRSSRGMMLTESGRSLWEDAENILKYTAKLRRKAQLLEGDVAGTLRIGVNNPPETLYIDEIIGRLGKRFAMLRFDCQFGPSQFTLSGLKNEEFDIAFFEGKSGYADIESISLEKRRILLLAPLDWADALAKAPIAQLQEYPWIFASEGCSLYKFTKEWQAEHNIHIEERIRSNNEEHSTMNFVASGLGLSVLTEEVVRNSVHRDRVAIIPQLSGSVTLSLGYLKSRQDEPMIQAAIQTVRDLWQEKTTSARATPS
ncbi:LysR family transcriptional regulator [Cerasicoccus frondis]|uniref:LysR family transcriptional regulator n=1 Tax=Cerasicoccus frondis TaxID=490090 RepID=UPI002852A5C9|nr:LysR family transcriptional regulator [Cerasicoccus frondis]